MSEITAVPLRPVKRSALTALVVGIGLLTAAGVAAAWAGTARPVAASLSAADYLARNAGRDGVRTTASGLQYKVLREGSGPNAAVGDVASVDYAGKLQDGTVFDASAKRGGPAQMPVMPGALIPGFTEALQLTKTGGEYRFWLPPELAYGPAGAGDGVIPPDALLVFDITVHGIERGGVARMMRAAGAGALPTEAAPR